MRQLPRFRLMAPTENAEALFSILGSVGLSVYLGSILEVIAIEGVTDDVESDLRDRYPGERYHRDDDVLIVIGPKQPEDIITAVKQRENDCGAVWLTLVDVEVEDDETVEAIRDGIRRDTRLLSGGGFDMAPA